MAKWAARRLRGVGRGRGRSGHTLTKPARVTGRGRLRRAVWLVSESFRSGGENLAAPDDHALAADLAERAGRLLLDLRATDGEADALRNAGDRQSHEFLMAELARERPADAVLSEEGIDDKARLSADRVLDRRPPRRHPRVRRAGKNRLGRPRSPLVPRRARWSGGIVRDPPCASRVAGNTWDGYCVSRRRRPDRRRGSPARARPRPLDHPGHRSSGPGRGATGPLGGFPPAFRRSAGGNPPRSGRAAPPPHGRQPQQSKPAGQRRCRTDKRRPSPDAEARAPRPPR